MNGEEENDLRLIYVPPIEVKPKPRARTANNDLYDILTEHFGVARTRTEQTRYGKVIAEMVEARATPEEMTKACVYVKATFENPSVFAVTKWFTAAQQAQEKLSPQQAAIEQLRRVQ